MFGKAKERRRQWALLGELLKNLRLLEALDFMDLSLGSSIVDWSGVRAKAACGRSLGEIAEDPGMDTPPGVLDALGTGERDGRLPQRLAELEAWETPERLFRDEDDGTVALVNRLVREAIDQGAGGILLVRKPSGEGELRVLHGEVWTTHSRYDAAECSAVVRRIWILAGQPYWAPKAGAIRQRIDQGLVELRVTPGLESGLGIEIVSLPPGSF